MTNEIFILNIDNNHKCTFEHPDHFRSWCRLKKPGKYVMRPPTSLNDERGINQNNLYWKRNQELSDAIGYSTEELHVYIMKSCGFLKETTVFGEPITLRLSSTKLKKSEFSQLMKKQDEICNEYNQMSVDEPDRVWLTLTTTDPLMT